MWPTRGPLDSAPPTGGRSVRCRPRPHAETMRKGGRTRRLLSEGSTLHHRPQRMPVARRVPAVDGDSDQNQDDEDDRAPVARWAQAKRPGRLKRGKPSTSGVWRGGEGRGTRSGGGDPPPMPTKALSSPSRPLLCWTEQDARGRAQQPRDAFLGKPVSVFAAEQGLDPQRLYSWRSGGSLGKAEPTRVPGADRLAVPRGFLVARRGRPVRGRALLRRRQLRGRPRSTPPP